MNHQSSINYISQDDPNLTYTNLLSTFTISDFVNNVLKITTIPSYTVDGVVKNFKGFYIGIDDSVNQLISEITLNQFKKFIDTYGETQDLPLYFKFVDVEQVSIEYDATYDGVNNVTHNDAVSTRGTSELVDSGSTIYLPDLSDVTKANLVNNNTYLYYFVGWQLEGDTSITYLPEEAFNAIQGTKFVSVWKLKEITLTINHDENTSTTEYYKEGSIIDKMSEPTRTGYRFNGFTLEGIVEDTINNTWSFTTNNPIITAKWLKYYNIKVEDKGGTANLPTSQACEGDFIEFTVDYQNTGSPNTTATGVTLTGDSSGTSFSFTMPANDVTITVSSSSCIVEGTLITLADGSKKKVEDLLLTDKLLVFNHNTGTYDIGNILFINNHNNISAKQRILNLEFSDGSMLRIVENHGLFDLETLKYEYIDEYNYENYINHRFYKGTLTGENYESGYATLISAYVTVEETRIYAIITAGYMNSFTNDFISMPTMLSYSNAIVNIFDYNENLMYDQEKMMADIEKYGLYTYDDFKHLITYESFIASPAMYLKVAIGKGYITEEEIFICINYLINKGLIQ